MEDVYIIATNVDYSYFLISYGYSEGQGPGCYFNENEDNVRIYDQDFMAELPFEVIGLILFDYSYSVANC